MKPYVIYGSGKWGRYAYLKLREEENILFFVDRDDRKWGTALFDCRIYSPEVLRDYPEATVCIAVENSNGIREYLCGLGVAEMTSFVLKPEDDKVPCIVYGSGENAKKFLYEYGSRFCVAFFVDDDIKCQGHRLGGNTVYPPGRIKFFPGMMIIDARDDASVSGIAWDMAERDILSYHQDNGLKPELPLERRKLPTVLVDVTTRRKCLSKEGVARVSDSIFDAMKQQGCSVIPVRNLCGTLVTDKKNFGSNVQTEEIVRFVAGDVLYLLDPTWNDSEDFSKFIKEAHMQGAKSYAFVHDFLPAYYPSCFTDSIAQPFFAWHDMILSCVDGIICNSKHTADTAVKYCEDHSIKRNIPLNVHYVHLGASLPEPVEEREPRLAIRDFVKDSNTFLMVGTLEPRKGHLAVLKAFQSLWNQGRDIRLLIIGHDGWLNADIKASLAGCPASKVLWIKDASDAELQWVYQNARALIAASLDEGFGLPLVEAAFFGLPVLCSDIDVFHEIAGEHAFYFKTREPAAIAEAVLAWESLDRKPDSSAMEVISWEDSARYVLEILQGKKTPYRQII